MNYLFIFTAVSISFSCFGQTAKDYYETGNKLNDSKDYQNAINSFSKSIELNPDDAKTYFSRANAKYLNKDFKGAVDDNSKAIELNPKYIQAYYNRGLAEHEMVDDK